MGGSGPLPPAGAQPPTGPSEAGWGAPSWSTKDKPLSSEQLEPTYRKGSECWSEGTGRGSSRAFLGTPGLKFVLETEEKIKKLLWADLKCFSAQHKTLVAQGDSGTALKSPSPTMGCPFQHPHSSPSPTAAPRSCSTLLKWAALYEAGTHRSLFFQEALFIYLPNTIFSPGNSLRTGGMV